MQAFSLWPSSPPWPLPSQWNTIIELDTSHSDLGILFDSQLKFHDHTVQVTTKANRVLGLIKKSFDYLDPIMLTQLFSTLVRPILEYNNAIWGPQSLHS